MFSCVAGRITDVRTPASRGTTQSRLIEADMTKMRCVLAFLFFCSAGYMLNLFEFIRLKKCDERMRSEMKLIGIRDVKYPEIFFGVPFFISRNSTEIASYYFCCKFW